ncbi:MAG: hypothetical protein E4H13_01800 [Calditrichales bacterium]|nr:MAG: hypothetical protein E4H13_01800 [Calditrichales bacterium]
MKTVFTICLLFIVVLFTQTLFAQEPFTLNGNGARAAGMGYAFTGVADDATAISWNAAGLTQLYSMEASVIGKFGFGSLTPDYSDFEVDVERGSSFQLNFASLVIPFEVGKMHVVGGVAYRTVFDFNNDVKYTIKSDLFDTSFENNQSGAATAISPALAVQINEMLSVGAVVNILMGSWESENIDSDGTTTSSNSSDFSGTSIDIGVLVKPNSQLSLGANLNLPYTLTEDAKNDESGMTAMYDLNVPLFFAIGAMYRASDNLSLAFDYRSRPWSNAEYFMDEVQIENYELENSNSIHVGMEYLAEAGSSVLPLRLGFYTLPTPSTDENDDQIKYTALTAGAGIVMSNLIIDGSFEYIFGSYVGDTESNGAEVDYAYTDFRITIGGTIHFGK